MAHRLDKGNLAAISVCSMQRCGRYQAAHASKTVCPALLLIHPTGSKLFAYCLAACPRPLHLLGTLVDEGRVSGPAWRREDETLTAGLWRRHCSMGGTQRWLSFYSISNQARAAVELVCPPMDCRIRWADFSWWAWLVGRSERSLLRLEDRRILWR
jgi:hypothetical protein